MHRFARLSALVILAAGLCRADWVQSNGPGAGTVNSLAVSGSMLVAGTIYSGVFISQDGGFTWTEANHGLKNIHVRYITVGGSRIFAGTLDGVWTRSLSDLTTGIRPDRFGPKTEFFENGRVLRPGQSINFNLAQRSPVSLSLSDVLGKETPLLRGILDQGGHSAVLDPRLPQGLYFLRMRTPGVSRVKRVVVGN